jgi:hypothetical protein
MITSSSSSGFSWLGRVLVCALVTAAGTLLWQSTAHSEDAVAIFVLGLAMDRVRVVEVNDHGGTVAIPR